MVLRTVTAVALIAFVSIIVYLGGAYLGAVVFLIMLMAQYEIIHAYRSAGARTGYFVPMFLSSVVYLASYFAGIAGFAHGIVFALLLSGLYIVFSGEYTDTDLLAAFMSILYPGACASLAAVMIAAGHAHTFAVLAIVCSAASDSFALWGGMGLGKTKLNERLSPKKTVEGSLFGLAGGILAGVLTQLIAAGFGNDFISTGNAALLGLVLSIISQMGDLFASAIKRRTGIKDFSNLLPGHGGVLDRVDGIFFALAACCAFTFIA